MVIKFKTSGPFFGNKLPIYGPLLDYHLYLLIIERILNMKFEGVNGRLKVGSSM